MSLVSVENLVTWYKGKDGMVHAVDNISFFLYEGESIGIAGESACGKSTLGHSIMRTIPDSCETGGDIIFKGKSIAKMSKSEFSEKVRWKIISMIFQGAMSSLDPVFTIKDQFVEVLKQHHFEGNYDNLIMEIIKSVGLTSDILNKYPHELSGGMKQRVVIAMALVLKPNFVISDEPTTALDTITQAQIIHLLKKLKNEGKSIMLITHDLSIISEIAEKIGIMYAGQMIEFGSSSEIYRNPKHPYTQALLNSIPKLRGGKETVYIKGIPPDLINPPNGCRFYDRCPEAMEKCKMAPPKIKTESGYVYCWLYDQSSNN